MAVLTTSEEDALEREVAAGTGTVMMLDPAEIVPCRYQTRAFVGPDEKNRDLVEFAGQLKAAGGNHTPVTVRRVREEGGSEKEGCDTHDGVPSWELACGERRVRACRLAGLRVLAIVRELSDEELWEICVSENLHNEQLSPLEQGAAVAQMLDHGWDYARIADHIGRSVGWVARRAKLRDLSARWRGMLGDPGQPVSRWGAGHLELVARYPEPVQDAMAERFQDYCDEYIISMSVADLRSDLAEFEKALAGAPWDLGDEALVSAAGSCAACVKRSDCQRELWDESELEGKPSGKHAKSVGSARCLDADCWERKQIAFLDRKREELAAKVGGPVILVGNQYSAPAPYKEQVVSEYQLERCKKSDAGAVPALCVDGRSAGQTIYVKPPRKGVTSGDNSPESGGEKKVSTDAERKDRVDELREKIVLRKLVERIEGMRGDLSALDDALLKKAPRLVAIFGTKTNRAAPWAYGREHDDPWRVLEKHNFTLDRSTDASIQYAAFRWVYENLFDGVAQVLCARLQSRMQSWVGMNEKGRGLANTEVECVAEVFGVDLEALRAEAAAEKPYPKGLEKKKEKKKTPAKEEMAGVGAPSAVDEDQDGPLLEFGTYRGQRVLVNDAGVVVSGYEEFSAPVPKGLKASMAIQVVPVLEGWLFGYDVRIEGSGVGCGGSSAAPSINDVPYLSRHDAIEEAVELIRSKIDEWGDESRAAKLRTFFESWAQELLAIPDGTGVCERCGCTEDTPCIMSEGDYCAWANDEQTLCTACG